jgi:hypothetical protein
MQSRRSESEFLQELYAQAEQQALLHETSLIPRQLDWLTSLIGRYPWQTALLLAVVTSIVLEVPTLW